MSKFQPSPEQQSIYDCMLDPTGPNILIQACAGSGKTTTLIEGLRLPCCAALDPRTFSIQTTVFLAFNKAIAEELSRRCPSGVQCSTFHSLGFRALLASLPRNRKPELRGNKVSKLCFNRLGEHPDVQPLIKLVSLLKSCWPRPSSVSELCSLHDLDFEKRSNADLAFSILDRSNEDLSTIDFDDMLYLPVLRNLEFQKADWLFVDEAQDTNDIQLEILDRMRGPRTRFVAVGDRHQAIYGFRGANADSMDRIRSRFQCTELPLSVSYRCSQSVVREAQKYLKQEIQN